MRTTIRVLVLALFAAALTACGGGGGGGGGGGDPVVDPGDPNNGSSAELVVVRYDYDNDGDPDLLTLDRTTSPYEIVEALRGLPDGEMTDVTTQWVGQDLPADVSDALSTHFADSFAVGTESEIMVPGTSGDDILVTVFE